MTDHDRDPDAVARLLRRRVAQESLELPVTGSSMAGTIASGSRVVVRSQQVPRAGEVWVVVSDDAEVVVHRIREINQTEIVTRGSGNSIDDPPLPIERLVGRVEQAVSPSGETQSFATWDRMRAAISFSLRRRIRAIWGD